MSNELIQDVQVYINSLKDDKQDYIDWLDSKGVFVLSSDTFTTLNTKTAQNISNGAMPNEIIENGEYDVTAYESVKVNALGALSIPLQSIGDAFNINGKIEVVT